MDFYSVLGVSRDASEREIKDAWRREALKNHPDRLHDAPEAARAEAGRRFKEAKEAYEVLSDDGRRALYNSSGRSAVYAAQRQGGATSSYYGSGFRPRARSGWSNFRYQQRTYARHSGVFSTFNLFRGFSRGMGRTDAYFHAGFAGILVLGVVFVAPAADALWEGLNRGKLFKHLKPEDLAAAGRATPAMSRPATGVLSEEERLAAQGVPPQIIASIRAFNEAAYSRPPSEPAQRVRNARAEPAAAGVPAKEDALDGASAAAAAPTAAGTGSAEIGAEEAGKRQPLLAPAAAVADAAAGASSQDTEGACEKAGALHGNKAEAAQGSDAGQQQQQEPAHLPDAQSALEAPSEAPVAPCVSPVKAYTNCAPEQAEDKVQPEMHAEADV